MLIQTQSGSSKHVIFLKKHALYKNVFLHSLTHLKTKSFPGYIILLTSNFFLTGTFLDLVNLFNFFYKKYNAIFTTVKYIQRV